MYPDLQYLALPEVVEEHHASNGSAGERWKSVFRMIVIGILMGRGRTGLFTFWR